MECHLRLFAAYLLFLAHRGDVVHPISSVLELGPDAAVYFVFTARAWPALQDRCGDFVNTSEAKVLVDQSHTA